MALTIGTISPLQAVGGTFAETPRFGASIPITASSCAASAVTSLTGTVGGLTTDMVLIMQWPASATTATCVGGRVSAANTLQLDFINVGGAVAPTNGTYIIAA